MLIAAIDVNRRKVTEIMAGPQVKDLMSELVTLYNITTGERITGFTSIEEARTKVTEAITDRYFHKGQVKSTPIQNAPITPPWARSPQPQQPQTRREVKSEGPVAICRRVFEEMKGERRKDVIEACVRLGVKRSTASTQYQLWKSTQKFVTSTSKEGLPQLAPGVRVADLH